jgi:hypothetical protein
MKPFFRAFAEDWLVPLFWLTFLFLLFSTKY